MMILPRHTLDVLKKGLLSSLMRLELPKLTIYKIKLSLVWRWLGEAKKPDIPCECNNWKSSYLGRDYDSNNSSYLETVTATATDSNNTAPKSVEATTRCYQMHKMR